MLQWSSPLKKYRDRTNAIFHSGAAISIAGYTYNVRVIPVTTYVAQLTRPPPDILALERSSLHRVTHFATNALALSDFYQLASAGGPL